MFDPNLNLISKPRLSNICKSLPYNSNILLPTWAYKKNVFTFLPTQVANKLLNSNVYISFKASTSLVLCLTHLHLQTENRTVRNEEYKQQKIESFSL